MIKVQFFAALREQLQCSDVLIEHASNIEDIKNQLIFKHPQWSEWLNKNNILYAVNHDMVDINASVKAGDEVAFFPPVTGG